MVAVASSGTATVTLPTDREILITREFDAPGHLVYKAWTTPELVRRWWSGHRGQVTSAEIDLRVGGRWRYVMVANGGFEVAFHGEYREIVPDERIVNTEVYEQPEASDEDGVLNIVTFAQAEGARSSRCWSRRRAGRSATRSSTPAWRPACRSRWSSWSSWRSRSAEAAAGLGGLAPTGPAG
jgi:uncharacterized protein YndB with AHSA1/START domain